MHIIEVFTTGNKCYQVGALLRPQGLMLHSIGTPQPSAAVLARYFDQYQPGGQSVCVHAFVQADGTVYQTLPWWMRGWHCGGSANGTHIGVEMTEPDVSMSYAESAEQITGTYHTAVELFAQLCTQYCLDPLEDGVIIGHAEGHRRGIASNHADPEYLWNVYGMGFTMDGFRRDVYEKMHENDNIEEEDDEMTRYKTVYDVPDWAKDDIRQLCNDGIIVGDEYGNLNLSEDALRCIVICKRMVERGK